MYGSEMLSIVIPAYNEEEILAEVIGQLVSDLDRMGLGFEMIIAENGSTDGTLPVARRLAAADPRLRVLHLDQPDYGRAMRLGFLAGSGTYLANFSVDFVDVGFLRDALSRLERCDIVLGSKYVANNRDGRPTMRRVGGRMLSSFVQLLFRLPVTDTHGLMVMRREAVLPHVAASRFGNEVFDTELIVRTHRAGISMCELPVLPEEKRPNRLGCFKRAARMLAQLARLRLVIWQEGTTSGTMGAGSLVHDPGKGSFVDAHWHDGRRGVG